MELRIRARKLYEDWQTYFRRRHHTTVRLALLRLDPIPDEPGFQNVCSDKLYRRSDFRRSPTRFLINYYSNNIMLQQPRTEQLRSYYKTLIVKRRLENG